MLIKPLSIEKMVVILVCFTISLVLLRVAYTGQLNYLFYIWNSILAALPLLCSRLLLSFKKASLKACLLLAGWLLFFPNAPYLITDIFHFKQSTVVPFWYDLVLVVSAAWNGLFIGLISLMQVEQFLAGFTRPAWVVFYRYCCIALGAYGVCLGRYERFNSWDLLTSPFQLIHCMANQVVHPIQHANTWGFCILFSSMFLICYVSIKRLQAYRAN